MSFQPAPPPPPTPDSDARTWAMLCHLAALAWLVGVPFGSILGPLIVWLIKRNDHPFIDAQGKSALNFHLSLTLYSLALLLTCVGIVLLPVIMIVSIIFSIIAAVKTSDGEHYEYPLSIRFIS